MSCCFFFKQKTAYEMRISDWSSDVCSSDLRLALAKRIRFVMGVILLRTLDDLAVDRVRDPAFDENHHRLVGLVGNDCSGQNALGHVLLLKPGPGRRAPVRFAAS